MFLLSFPLFSWEPGGLGLLVFFVRDLNLDVDASLEVDVDDDLGLDCGIYIYRYLLF